MKKYIPLVSRPQDTELQKDQFELWHESHKENLAFRHFFEDTETGLIYCAYDGFYVDRNGAYAKIVTEKFGFERTMYMLANTVVHKDYDGRFSHDIKAWAHSVCEGMPSEDTRQYILDLTNPGILDIFTKRILRMYEEYKLSEQNNGKETQLDADRIRNLFRKALNWIAELENGADLYETLHETMGMTNDEIEIVGFSLKEHYDLGGQESNPQEDMQM